MAKPQPEEVVSSSKPTQSAAKETTTDTNQMIKNEIANLNHDIKRNEQLLIWLNKAKRRKRDLGPGGYGAGPPIYNRRLPPQMGPRNWPPVVPPQSPAVLQRGQGVRYPNYDYEYDVGPPFGQAPPKTMEPLPENIERALGTINDFLANPNSNISTETPKPRRITTTLATATLRITTTNKITSTPMTMTSSITNAPPRRRKPTSSVDDTKSNSGKNNVTIKACKF